MSVSDPFLSSLMAQAAINRLAGVAAALAGLWVAVWWAVSLP